MFELSLSQIPAVLPLIATLDQAVLPRAVLEGTTPGWVFADDSQHPRSVLIGLPCGYFFGAGTAPRGQELEDARQLVTGALIPRSQAGGNFGFLFSFCGQDWIDSLPLLLPGRSPLHIFRRGMRFLFLWIVPIGFLTYYPALYLLDRDDPLGLPRLAAFASPLATLLFCLVVRLGWRAALRRYTSTGS